MRRSLVGIWFLIAAVGLIAGCSGGAKYPATSKVTGKVTMNGAAVAGALVSFSPDGAGNAAAGMTDPGGNFTLTTFQSGDGAVPGKYKVSIAKMDQAATVAMPAATADNPDAAYAAAEAAGADVLASGKGGGGGAKKADNEPKDLLPAMYKDPNTSGLTAEVTKGGENNFMFNLKL